MSVAQFHLNGETFYTHTSWFSERQINAWASIPLENNNLAFYYSLATVSLSALFLRRVPLVSSLFTSYGRLAIGFGGSTAASYAAWLSYFKLRQGSELERVIAKNECKATPLWRKAEQVVDLRSRDYTSFMNRRKGQKFTVEDITKYAPDNVLSAQAIQTP